MLGQDEMEIDLFIYLKVTIDKFERCEIKKMRYDAGLSRR